MIEKIKQDDQQNAGFNDSFQIQEVVLVGDHKFALCNDTSR